MKFPNDISKDFLGSWEAFNELPNTRDVPADVLAEAFRIFLKQAGVKTRDRHKVSEFITVNKRYQDFIRKVKLCYLLYQLKPERHEVSIALNADQMICVDHGFTISGSVLLRPQRLSLDYLLNRMNQAKVFGKVPPVVLLGKKKYPGSRRAVREQDYQVLFRDGQTTIRIARLKGDMLLFNYELHFDDIVPLYPTLDKQLFAIWRRASIGDLK